MDLDRTRVAYLTFEGPITMFSIGDSTISTLIPMGAR
jgi:hypothetical protein